MLDLLAHRRINPLRNATPLVYLPFDSVQLVAPDAVHGVITGSREKIRTQHLERKAILYVPGSLTATETLCQQLNVSRTAVRGALKVLEVKGLVEVLPRGVRSRPRVEWDLLDPQVLDWLYDSKPDRELHEGLLELREVIEPGAAELATARATPEQIALLHECCRRMGSSAEDTKRHVAADVDFHTTILAACNNEFLTRMSAMIQAALRASISLTAQRIPMAASLAADWITAPPGL